MIYYKNDKVTLYNDDCIEVMKELPDDLVDLTITSPPYDNLRKYKGYMFDFENVAKQLYRITKNGGMLIWVVGDATINGSETCTSFKQALYFKELGFNLHDTMIFKKKNFIPKSHNRYEQSWEYMFAFSKGRPKTFNPIKIETSNYTKKNNWGSRNNFVDEQCARKKDEITRAKLYKIKDNIFEYSIGGGKYGHPAIFPDGLAYDQIISWSNEGDMIFDPFSGSGTTISIASIHERNAIGIEISKEYCEMIKTRLNDTEKIILEKETNLDDIL